MQIIITENQYKTIIEETSLTSGIDFLKLDNNKSAKGLFKIGSRSLYNHFNELAIPDRQVWNKGLFLESNITYYAYINIDNLSGKKNVIIENVTTTASQGKKIDNLRFTKEPFTEDGVIQFGLTNRNTNEGYNSFTIYITLLIGNVRDTIQINFSYYCIPPKQTVDKCKAGFSNTQLKNAEAWWKSWLNNKTTKLKFAKNHNYTLSKVEDIFKNYLKILDQIKLEYVFSDKPNAAWVWVAFSKGYDIPITINCSIPVQNVELTLIHEIQHILSSYHKLHPFRDDIASYYSNMIEDAFTDKNNLTMDEIVNILTKNGFNLQTSTIIAEMYFWKIQNDEVHLKSDNEKLSTLSEVRRSLNLKPEQQITKAMLINIRINPFSRNDSNGEIIQFICQWIYSGMSLSEWLNHNNSIAKNKNIQNNTQV